jgi:two-component system, NarL family, capsular synthesis sensor histidine kinase RcsC
MERFFAESKDSPLEMLRTLEGNLKRERRIFTVVIGLLIFSVICVVLLVGLALHSANLRREQEGVHQLTKELDRLLLRDQNVLTSARLVVELGAQGVLSPSSGNTGPVDRCPDNMRGSGDTFLQLACREALQLLGRPDDASRLQFARFDGSASYGSGFFPAAVEQSHERMANEIRALISSASTYMTAHGIDPMAAARDRRTMWFRPPPGLGFSPQVTLGFSVVAKANQPYALVFSSIDLQQLLADATPESLESKAALFDADGNVLAGNPADVDLRIAEKRLPPGEAGRFTWIPGHGWGARSPALSLDIGHITLALPVLHHVYERRWEEIPLVTVTLALVLLLLAMHRYWNNRFLTPSYDQACRAVEGEILNHLLVHATPVGLCSVLQSNYRIVAANQIARSVLLLDEASVRLPAGLCDAFEARAVNPDANGPEPIKVFEYSLERPDSTSARLKISYTPAIINGTDVLFCAIADITENYEAEKLAREAKETSEAAARARLSFFASMSHEIRTPLSSLVGNLELVRLGPLAAEQHARVEAMQASADGLLQIVNDVLDLSKIDIGEMRLAQEWSSLRESVVRVVIAHAPIANRQGLQLFVVVDRACPDRVFLDPIRFSQILNNLLSNALKFTYSGKVVVRVDWREGAIELTVADSGMGIPDELKARLFQPFTQGETHRLTQARGTGLGLSICSRLAELMHGRISLESTEGVGTRITVTLPMRVDEQEDLAAAAAPPLTGRCMIFCRAREYQEWFEPLIDQKTGSAIFMPGAGQNRTEQAYDYALVTDEFSRDPDVVAGIDSRRTIWVTQNGPLVPAMRHDGSVEVCVFSLNGLRTAIGMIGASGRQDVPRAAPETGTHTWSMPEASELTVLVAEDNRINRALLRDQLHTLGVHVVEAGDGEEALHLMEKVQVDVVLTDVDMPNMTGSELLAEIRARHLQMPVYAVSASAGERDIKEGLAQGFTDYLTKPLALSILARVLGDVMIQRAAGEAKLAEDDATDDIPRFPVVPAAYVQILTEQLDRDIASLEGLLQSHELEELRRWAHRVSGGLSMLGQSSLMDTCEELRSVIRSSSTWSKDVDDLSRVIHDELKEFRHQHIPVEE